MRAMPIRTVDAKTGLISLRASFKKNWKHYLQEALGLAIFMVSACLFASLLEANNAPWKEQISNGFTRRLVMGLLMGATALLIFYSPLTAPSGAHINPAVTISFLLVGKVCPADAFFYCIFQVMGGTMAVYGMQIILGQSLVDPPVNSCATTPVGGLSAAAITEFSIALITMLMVLFTSNSQLLKKCTRLFAAMFVVSWVVMAGPISGFGMNPARSFASALPANIWTGFWIYLLMPFAGMFTAAGIYLLVTKGRDHSSTI